MPTVGDRVEFLGFGVPDQWSRLQQGTLGTISFVDSVGTLHVDWDNGIRLGLVTETPLPDRYRVLDPPRT